MDLRDIYKQASGVDIKEQERIWNERGKGYYGEYLVFERLFFEVPGHGKILTNLHVPTAYGTKTEIDLVLIHETGLYVFEVKHYKGTIYGRVQDNTWTQYFKTTPNQRFNNPIKQNRYHIEALKRHFPGVPVHSVVVFTSDYCDLRIEESATEAVCSLGRMMVVLNDLFRHNPEVFSATMIDKLFGELKGYALGMERPVAYEGKEIPFHRYLEQIKQIDADREKRLEEKVRDAEKRAGKKVRRILIAAVVFSLLIGIGNRDLRENCNERIAEAEREVAAMERSVLEMERNFRHVQPLKGGEIELSEDLVVATEQKIEKLDDFENAVSFSCKLVWNGETYGLRIGQDAKYIVQLKDGTVQEYDLYGPKRNYSVTHKIGGIHKEFALAGLEVYDVDTTDIKYIKLTGLLLWGDGIKYGQDLMGGIELELYDAEKNK